MYIQHEDLYSCLDEILAMSEDNFDEITMFQFKYNPDVVLFEALHKAKALFILTLRDNAGVLKGYSVNVMNKDMLTQVTKSSCLSLYVVREARGLNSIRLIKRTEEFAATLGAILHTIASPFNNDLHTLLNRRGYIQLETLYTKHL